MPQWGKTLVFLVLLLLAGSFIHGQSGVSRGEQVMKALAAAYSRQVGPAEFRDGDWAVPIRGVYYYWAEGRLLPAELRSRYAEYDSHGFYNYPAELPPWKAPTKEESDRMRAATTQRRSKPPKRSNHFTDALFRASNRDDSWDRVKQIRFLGRTTLVHYSILEELSLVEERILRESKTNAALRRWIADINTVEGWSWRNVAETQSRSYHAYGVAVDILPKSLGGQETYWLWAANRNPEWWAVPYSRRFHPPDAVIKAFEAYGFIWGGKWGFYDTMHFEYRPEIFILGGLPLSDNY